jgi:XTP/dITP diphosphohydrolase
MRQLIIATGNAHKVAEFDQLLKDCGFEVRSAKVCSGMPHVLEDGDTFDANAAIKARALRKLAPEDVWVVSDDSGLEVDALGGAPGIHSARYAGEGAADRENLCKLLSEMRDFDRGARGARFRCVLCLIDPAGKERFFDGACEGRMATQPKGNEGFGYDPAFIPDGYEETFGQLGESVKSRLSHRARAVEKMRSFLNEL